VLPVTGKFSAGKQRALAVEVMKAIGFPFNRGRLDESEHPFTEGVPGDVRVTTRFDPVEPFSGLLGALHETGHAMYDVGMPASWRDQPVGRDRGMALEESQSLLLEMIIGRSAPFLRYLQPLLQKHYGATGPEWEFDNLHRMLTRVRRSLIRVDADEMSYSLHIMQRYDIEKQLLAGKLAVRDLPEAWNSGMEQRFGARPTGTADGCLQDMHWALGHFGYFPSYALGLVIAAQLWEALRKQLPELDTMIERGEFAPVFSWLRDNMHGFGAKLPIKELIRQASGQGLSANALLRYLQGKYLAESA
jgi:carboxypeptidase Taq